MYLHALVLAHVLALYFAHLVLALRHVLALPAHSPSPYTHPHTCTSVLTLVLALYLYENSPYTHLHLILALISL